MESITLEVNQRSCHVKVGGEGKPVLLVHGFPLDHRMWRHQWEALARQYRVVCPDLPGFGKSDSLYRPQIEHHDDQAMTTPLTMADFADWLVAVLDNLSVEGPVTFCGLSMGGYIGWEFFNRHPDRLARLVACNTRAANDSEAVKRGRLMAARDVLEHGTGLLVDAMVPKLFGDSLREDKLDANDPDRQAIADSIRDTSVESIAAGHLAMAQRHDATEWLARIKIPTLLISGQFDEITPASEMQSVAFAIDRSKFVCIGESAHLSPLEQPEACNSVLLDWLGLTD